MFVDFAKFQTIRAHLLANTELVRKLTTEWLPSSIYQIKCSALMLAATLCLFSSRNATIDTNISQLLVLVEQAIPWLCCHLTSREPEELAYRLQVLVMIANISPGMCGRPLDHGAV
jgi:hypothetical protein